MLNECYSELRLHNERDEGWYEYFIEINEELADRNTLSWNDVFTNH